MPKTLLTTCCLLLICQSALAVDFQKNIAEARKKDTQNRPMVVSFGAPWCGWCRKMDVDTFQSSEVKAVAEKFVWVKIDVEEEIEIAARYQVEGLPRTIVLDVKGRIIGSADGYLSPARFVKFLNESLTKPLPDKYRVEELLEQLVKAEDEAEKRKAVTALVEILSKPDRLAREEILVAMKQHKGLAGSVLLDLMSDERLAMRAAAAGCLKHCLAAELEFDPFADKEARDVQLIEWRNAVEAKS